MYATFEVVGWSDRKEIEEPAHISERQCGFPAEEINDPISVLSTKIARRPPTNSGRCLRTCIGLMSVHKED